MIDARPLSARGRAWTLLLACLFALCAVTAGAETAAPTILEAGLVIWPLCQLFTDSFESRDTSGWARSGP